MTFAGASGVNATSTRIAYTGTPDMGPCSMSLDAHSKGHHQDGCIDMTRTDTTITSGLSSETRSDFSKFTQHNIVDDAAASGAWHASGSMDAIINNWKGSLTYTGAAKAPTYHMGGMAGENVSGSLDADSKAGASAGLLPQMSNVLVDSIPNS